MLSRDAFVKWAVLLYNNTDTFKKEFKYKLIQLIQLYKMNNMNLNINLLSIWEWFTDNFERTRDFEKRFSEYLEHKLNTKIKIKVKDDGMST